MGGVTPAIAYVAVATAAAGASLLTLYSGFGLGTLLLPVFACFVPAPVAVAATAVVHLANNVLKTTVAGREARRDVVLRFGVPAVLFALAGAALLGGLGRMEPLAEWGAGSPPFRVTPVNLGVGILMLGFAALDLVPSLASKEFPTRLLPLGGAVSGFFGGLSGHQGAFRTAFLAKVGLEPAEFVGTTAVIGLVVDLVRVAVYAAAGTLISGTSDIPLALVGAGIAGAALGILLGATILKARKVTMRGLRLFTGVLVALFGVALAAGILGE